MWEYNYLEHHGIVGQKWGVRRYQNMDGSLTVEGKKRYKSTSRLALRELPDYRKNLKTVKKEFKKYKTENKRTKFANVSLKEKKKIGREYVNKRLEAYYGKEKANALSAAYGKVRTAMILAEIGGLPLGLISLSVDSKAYRNAINDYSDYLDKHN